MSENFSENNRLEKEMASFFKISFYTEGNRMKRNHSTTVSLVGKTKMSSRYDHKIPVALYSRTCR